MKIQNRKIIYKINQGVDFVIFDEINSEYILELFGNKYTSEILYVRPKPIYLNFNFFYLFFKSLLSILRSKEKDSLKSILNKSYTLAMILIYKSKSVVTLIDNNTDFHWASRYLKTKYFIAIQNGFRLAYVKNNPLFYIDHYFCFGKHEVVSIPKQGHHINNFYPCGSLIADVNLSKNKVENTKYDILVISCWRGNIGFTKEVRDTMSSMKKMDELLARYLSENTNIKAAVILRSERNSEHWFIPELEIDEESYFKSIYKDSATIIENDFKNKNIYKLILESNFLISTLSTALIEGFGIGKKSLLCNFTGIDDYHVDFSEDIITKSDDYNTFSKNIDYIIQMPEREYNKKYFKLQKYYMSLNGEFTVKEYILKKIEEIIKNKL